MESGRSAPEAFKHFACLKCEENNEEFRNGSIANSVPWYRRVLRREDGHVLR